MKQYCNEVITLPAKTEKLYQVLGRKESYLHKEITFQARGLPPWTISVSKTNWTPEVEKMMILAQIKKLKRESKKMNKVHRIELTETQLNILWSLAVSGASSSKSDLWKKRKIGELGREVKVGEKSTVERALIFLETNGLIKIGTPQGGRRKMGCDLTTAGLFRLLDADLPEVWKNLDTILSRHGSKVPLIFGKWNKFIKDGVANDFRIRIIEYFKLPGHFYLSAYNILKERKPEKLTEQLLADDLTRHVILPWLFPYVYELCLPRLAEYLSFPRSPFPTKAKSWHSREIESWWAVILRYRCLKRYLLKELDRLGDLCDGLSEIVKEWKSIIPKLEKAPKEKRL